MADVGQSVRDGGSRHYITSLSTNQNREKFVVTSYVRSQTSTVILEIE